MKEYEVHYRFEGSEESTVVFADDIFEALDKARKTWGKYFTGFVKLLGRVPRDRGYNPLWLSFQKKRSVTKGASSE